MRTAKLFSASLFVAACGLYALPASAQNLIQDGDFESATPGSYSFPQTFDGGNWFVFAGNVVVDNNPTYVLEGAQSIYLNPDPGTNISGQGDGIVQFVPTIVGETYQLSFIANADQADNQFFVLAPVTDSFSVPVKPFTGTGTGDYTSYSYTFTATSTSTPVALGATNMNLPQGSTELDNVSLVAITPEPNSMVVLAGFGLVIAGKLARNRRK